MAKHEIVGVRLYSTDIDRTILFYQGLFNWEMNHISDECVAFMTPGSMDGVFVQMTTFTPGDSMSLSVEVPEFESYTAKVVQLGGTVSDEPVEFPGYGSSLLITDPDGNQLALWRPIVR